MVWNQSGAVGEHVVRGLDIVIGNVLNVWIITRQEEKAEEEEVYGAGSAFFIANDGGGGGGGGGGSDPFFDVQMDRSCTMEDIDVDVVMVEMNVLGDSGATKSPTTAHVRSILSSTGLESTERASFVGTGIAESSPSATSSSSS